MRLTEKQLSQRNNRSDRYYDYEKGFSLNEQRLAELLLKSTPREVEELRTHVSDIIISLGEHPKDVSNWNEKTLRRHLDDLEYQGYIALGVDKIPPEKFLHTLHQIAQS